jgi:putative ABC transport system permease protein
MRFILTMAWRDSRASRRKLLLYSLSVVLGIAALVSIGSFSANVKRAVQSEAKGLLGADLYVTSPAPLTAPVTAYLDALGGAIAREHMLTSMMVFPATKRMRLVQVHALEGGFPFYGTFETDPEGAPGELASGKPVVILEPTLMAQYGVRIGDPVKLGTTLFTVVGALKEVPGESPAVTMMAPRAFIPLAALAGTGLAGNEALARYRDMVRLPAGRDADAVATEMRARFPTLRLSFETVEQRKRNLGQALANVDGFLSLVGFVALVLGGIGVSSALHAYVREKVATVAVLRCLGASARRSFAVYVVQGLALGIAGACVGGALGLAVQKGLPALGQGYLPMKVDFFVSWPALLRGAGAGVVICLLFSLFPLLSVRRIPPLAALRSAVGERAAAAPDPWALSIAVAIAISVAGFAVWQTGVVAVGLGFAAMLGLGFAILFGLGHAVAWASRRFTPPRLPYVVRQGLANLHRPNNRTILLLLSLGLGSFLVLTIFMVRATLLREIRGSGGEGRPNLVFFDIQDDQIGPLEAAAAAAGTPVLESAPIVTMRMTSIRGRPVADFLEDKGPGKGSRMPAWALRREYRSTFRGSLTGTEKIVEGTFTAKADPAAGPVPISVEEGLARDLQLKVGDTIDWDVQGLPVKTRVGSLRSVEWRRMEPNFFVVFPLGVLEEAPKTYVAAMKTASADESARVQQALVERFPNVTAIDLGLVVETLDTIFGKVAFAVQFMALFTVATGLVVLAGSILSGRHQRLRETALLRTLGASRRQVALIQLVEYAVLGIQAAIVGAVLAVAANSLLAHFVFHVAPAVFPGQMAAGVIVVAALAIATGFAAGRGVVDHSPLETLRQET